MLRSSCIQPVTVGKARAFVGQLGRIENLHGPVRGAPAAGGGDGGHARHATLANHSPNLPGRALPSTSGALTSLPSSHRQRDSVRTQALGDREKEQQTENSLPWELVVIGLSFALAAVTLLLFQVGGGIMDGAEYFSGSFGLSAVDLFGAALWSVALWFASPWQLLLLFLGRVETDRPSDWVLRQLGLALQFDVDAVDYVAPPAAVAAAMAIFVASGLVTAVVLEASLGDGTWAVSGGIGALFAAGLYEVGRPERLNVEEAQALERAWQDFAAFADEAMVKSGRCHESEIFACFRRRSGRYRTQEALSDARLRDMIRNWQPRAERSRAGWYKNVSLASAQQPARTVVTEFPAPAEEQPAAEQPAAEQPAAEQPAAEQPAAEQPAAEQPAAEQPAAEQPAAEQPAAEQPAAEQPAAEQPAAEQPAADSETQF